MKQAPMKRQKVKRMVIDDKQTNLRVALDTPFDQEGPRYMDAIPDWANKHAKLRGYVWIGTSAQCFGHIPAKDFLALADAIRRGP